MAHYSKQKEIFKDITFHPKISKKTQVLTKKLSKIPVEERLLTSGIKKKKQLKSEQKKALPTFTPRIN